MWFSFVWFRGSARCGPWLPASRLLLAYLLLATAIVFWLSGAVNAAWSEEIRKTGRTSQALNADNRPPTIEFVYPPSTVYVVCESARLRLRVHASDPDGVVQKVRFFENQKLIGIADKEPYEVNWVVLWGGVESIAAEATDNLGVTTRTEIRLRVRQACFGSNYDITAPTNQAVIKGPADVTVSAILYATDGEEDPVDVYLGTNRVGTITGDPPYNFVLTILPAVITTCLSKVRGSGRRTGPGPCILRSELSTTARRE
jgi:hypothetical protein